MGFANLSGLDLSGEEAAPVAIDYTEVEQVVSDMFTEDSFFHFEILGTITIRNPSSSLWHGGPIKVSSTRVQILVFTNNRLKDSRKTPQLQAGQGLAQPLKYYLQNPAFDSRLAGHSCRPYQ